jgi:hypothetical protein
MKCQVSGNSTLGLSLLLVLTACGSDRVNAQNVDPKSVVKVVSDGRVKFSSTKRVTVWLDDNQSYSVEPVVVGPSESHTFRSASEMGILQSRPVPPPPPRPPDHGGPRPPLPIPPRPTNRRPTPQPPPKTKSQLAKEGVIVGRLKTDGISQSNWKLPNGTYTIVLTLREGEPVAALVNADGEYAVSFDNLFFLDAQP